MPLSRALAIAASAAVVVVALMVGPTHSPSAGADASISPSEASFTPEPPRPNIVVIYMDDFSPKAARLWKDHQRTPDLARWVEQGITLNASGSTPLCCPARANVLTGRYGHRNGITRNEMRKYDPSETVAVELQAAGYHTAYVGKFLNSLARWAPDRRSMEHYAQGWDDFDVIWENQGHFYDYRLWTRHGVQKRGSAPRDHSSRVAGLRAAAHIRATPRDEPLFMIISLYDGHPPQIPMAKFAGDPACRKVVPWAGPAYDEANVSDKPRFVRSRSRLRERSYSLRRRCEAILGVDWVSQRVSRALKKTGRLDDTLIVFTADNGVLMGEHRLESKGYPYSTPVPMYAWWPQRWGSAGRSIEEPVQNVDLAPTFCGLAGCTMEDIDGMDLIPLLDGDVDRLDRTSIYEEILHPGHRWPDPAAVPAWYGLRTTLAYSDVRWVYTEYATGERELYDLTNDPNQLKNLAGERAVADTQQELAAMLHESVVGPDHVRFSRDPTARTARVGWLDASLCQHWRPEMGRAWPVTEPTAPNHACDGEANRRPRARVYTAAEASSLGVFSLRAAPPLRIVASSRSLPMARVVSGSNRWTLSSEMFRVRSSPGLT